MTPIGPRSTEPAFLSLNPVNLQPIYSLELRRPTGGSLGGFRVGEATRMPLTVSRFMTLMRTVFGLRT